MIDIKTIEVDVIQSMKCDQCEKPIRSSDLYFSVDDVDDHDVSRTFSHHFCCMKCAMAFVENCMSEKVLSGMDGGVSIKIKRGWSPFDLMMDDMIGAR